MAEARHNLWGQRMRGLSRSATLSGFMTPLTLSSLPRHTSPEGEGTDEGWTGGVIAVCGTYTQQPPVPSIVAWPLLDPGQCRFEQTASLLLSTPETCLVEGGRMYRH